jgi:hypothetical protein
MAEHIPGQEYEYVFLFYESTALNAYGVGLGLGYCAMIQCRQQFWNERMNCVR